ncbi:MAG: hypothetical protein WAZ19_14760 [Anaerolineae bacterium]
MPTTRIFLVLTNSVVEVVVTAMRARLAALLRASWRWNIKAAAF